MMTLSPITKAVWPLFPTIGAASPAVVALTTATNIHDAVWPALAAMAGAVTALSSSSYQEMTRGKIALTLFAATTFALFVGPLVVQWWTKGHQPDAKLVGAFYYLLSAGSNIFLPRFIQWLASIGPKP